MAKRTTKAAKVKTVTEKLLTAKSIIRKMRFRLEVVSGCTNHNAPSGGVCDRCKMLNQGLMNEATAFLKATAKTRKK